MGERNCNWEFVGESDNKWARRLGLGAEGRSGWDWLGEEPGSWVRERSERRGGWHCLDRERGTRSQ